MAPLAATDVDEIRTYLTAARADVLQWLPDFEWTAAWKSEAATERANMERRLDGSPWGAQPLIWTDATAWFFISAVVDCIDAICLCITIDTPTLVPNALTRVALEAGAKASWLLQPGVGARSRVARRILIHHASARQIRSTVSAVNSQRRPSPRWRAAEYPPTNAAVLREAHDLDLCCRYEEQRADHGETRRLFTCDGQALPTTTRLASDFAAKIQTPGAYAIWSNAVHAGWSAITADWSPATMTRTTHRESLWAAAINAAACAMDPCLDALVHLGSGARLAQWNQSHTRNRSVVQRMNLPFDWTSP
ncbi:MAG: hypothetical protein WBH47_15520 [Streptosporangiaceae bacterium]